MMRRILTIPAIVALLLAAALPAAAAPRGVVAVVCDVGVAPYRALVERFTETCDLAVRVLPPEEARRPGLEGRLRAAGTNAVLAVGMQAAAAVEELRELPVLLAMVPNAGAWVDARPNRFGIEMALAPRANLEILRRAFPQARRVGLVFDPAETGGYVREAREAAAALGMELLAREIARPGDLARRLEELRGAADVIWLLPDPTVLQGENLNLLLLASFESRVPLYAFARKYAELGAVAAAHLDPAALGAQAAAILHCLTAPAPGGGARREYARGATLVLNAKVAAKMGLRLEPALLEEADDVLR